MTVNGTTTTNPVTSQFTDEVSIPLSELLDLDNLTVTVALTDQESVQNLNLTLVAPNGDEITLVDNQNNAAGTANTGTGLHGGNAIGVFGFTTGADRYPGGRGRDDLRRQRHPRHLRPDDHRHQWQ